MPQRDPVRQKDLKPERQPTAKAPAAEQVALVPGTSLESRMLYLQRTVGNRAVNGMIQRQDTPAARPRPSLSDLVTIANSAINAEYVGAERDGLNDFESIVSSTYDFGPVLVGMVGNTLWALGCFATGGVALAGLAGVVGGVAGPVASTTVDRTAFHTQATDMVENVRTHLLNQVVRVTNDVDAQATANNWDEFQTRRELLLRLLKPQYIATAAGGLPTVNRGAIARMAMMDLLTRANSYGPGLISAGGGRFIYDYTVSRHFTESGFWPFDSTSLRPVGDWTFARGQTSLYIPQGGNAAYEQFRREALIQPATMQFLKSVYVHSSGTSGDLEVFLDGSNRITSVNRYGVFEKLGEPAPRPAARSAPRRETPLGAARSVLAAMWSDTGGQPPWVRGQDLVYASMPGRSRATR